MTIVLKYLLNSITKPKLASLAIVVFLTSCSHYIINDAGYIRPPKGYRFSYKKKLAKLVNNDVIDTTAIYYLENSNYYRDSDAYKNSDQYIRFYVDGRFRMQGTKTFPKTEEVNNVDNGLVGYYKLTKNTVRLQVYGDLNGGSDQLEFGMIDDDKNLVLLNENPRTTFGIGYSAKGIKKKIDKTSYFNPKVYKKIRLEGMTYVKPVW